jgi:hypothetical protein
MPGKDYEPKLKTRHIELLLEKSSYTFEEAKAFAVNNNLRMKAVVSKITQLPELSYEKKPANERVGAIRDEIRDICDAALPALDRMPKEQLTKVLRKLKGN